jgi:hypothetical protein
VVYKDSISNDTIVSYQFKKQEIRDLRTYVTKLEEFKDLYNLDEKIIESLKKTTENYKTIIINKDIIIDTKDKETKLLSDVNTQLTKDLIKYKNRSRKWPYFIGAGFIGGIVLCQLVK